MTAVAVPSTSSGRSLGWWGTVCLIATEAMLFALLLFAFFFLRANNHEWPIGGIAEPELAKSGIRTVILLGSTIPAVAAERAARRGDRRTLLVGLATTFVMGALFLAGHVEEYVHLWPELTPSTNAYGSAFYTITGFHALHLGIGLVVVAFLLWRAAAGHYTTARHESVENGLLYWHFVDVVWVFVYSSLYLSERLL